MNVIREPIPNQTLKIREVDGVEILSLVDNSVDFLSTVDKESVQSFGQWTKERHGQEWARTHSQLPLAQHGFSMLVRVSNEGKSSSFLFDTGGSSEAVIVNAERMGLDLSEVECIVLSHGHYDHFGGLRSALKAVNRANLPIIVHEDMFGTRGVADSDGTIRKYPEFPTEEQLSSAQLVRTKQPSLIVDGTVLITGEIPRRIRFEKGLPQHRVQVNGEWQPDPWIWDDRAIVINVKEKGLLVISGCAHAGIINTTIYAQQITGLADVHAIMGGFHLAGKEQEGRINATVKELQRINPKLLVPSHCTGWRALCAIANTLPQTFVWNSVGNLYKF